MIGVWEMALAGGEGVGTAGTTASQVSMLKKS